MAPAAPTDTAEALRNSRLGILEFFLPFLAIVVSFVG